MGKINYGRVIGGGLLAGLVINICEFLVNGLWLKQDWEDAMKALGKSTAYGPHLIVLFNVWGFLIGIFAVWFYAAIRPRYGAGPKTASCAAISVWILAYLMASIIPASMEMFPMRLMWIGVGVGLVEMLIGTILGAWVYKEESAPAAMSATAK